MKPLLMAFLVMLAAGCASPGSREAQRYFVLEVPPGGAPAAGAARAASLVVTPTSASSFYDTQRMVYSRSPGTRAYYQFNGWTESPARQIHELLLSRLDGSGAFRNVATAASGVRGDLVLNTRIEEIYHDAAGAPGSARITLSAELVDPARGALLARRTFSRAAPAAAYEAHGAVQGFGVALGALLDEVVIWVNEVAPR